MLPAVEDFALARRAVRFFSLCIVVLSFGVIAANVWAQNRGQYVGRIIAEWKDDGRRMELKAALEYIAPDGRRWRVPAGAVVDGATIPQFMWSIIGGPFEGKYRNASVIHDHFCDIKTRRFEDVHRVFYDAMLTSDVSQSRAWLMYKAVERFGPQWDPPKVDPKCLRADGRIDFDRCTEASAMQAGPTRTPRADRSDVLKFLEEMKGSADAADLNTLRSAVERR